VKTFRRNQKTFTRNFREIFADFQRIFELNLREIFLAHFQRNFHANSAQILHFSTRFASETEQCKVEMNIRR